MRTKLLLASLLLSGAGWAQTSLPPFVMTTPNEYRIIGASPNGKWACGVYADYGDERYGFLWNLESGEIELLNPASPSLAYAVSDNGIVVGEFTDYTYRSNGASVKLAGYWANHKWNRLELPTNTVNMAGASSITPDGHYIVGHIEENGNYIGYVWKDGKIYRKLNDKNGVSMPYCISPDGQYVGGWIQDKNRQACLWGPDGSYTTLSTYESPWSSGRDFTPDGKTLLYYGGWQPVDSDQKKYGVPAFYDMETGEKSMLVPENDSLSLDFFDISNKNTTMCELGELGYIQWKDKGAYAYKYLKEQGINLADYHVFVNPDGPTDSEGETLYQITRASTISADDNVMGFQYYNDDKDENGNYSISMQSMVVKFNQVRTGLRPVSVKATQLSGMHSVLVAWKPNVAANGITGYNVYRDGVKVNKSLVSDESFSDADVADGEHKYVVSAVYGTEESEKSDEATVDVTTKGLSAPDALYTKQHGYNSAYMEWNTPTTNFGSLTYFNTEGADIETFGLGVTGVSYETAIRFDKTQMSAYKGQKLTSVGFYPMEAQGGWKINIYTHADDGYLELLYTQPVTQKLNYGMHNVVKLDTPVDIPSGDLLVSLEVAVNKESQSITALDYGRAVEGYSDLLRLTTEDNFYSVGQLFQDENYLYEASWAIDATVSPDGADLSKDDVKEYNIYTDGKKVDSSSDLSYVVRGLSEGTHSLGVSTVYANGSESPVATSSIDIVNDESQLRGVDKVNVDATNGTMVKATWDAPLDRDHVDLQYCMGEASSQSVVAPSENNYGMMVGAIYPSKTFRGRNGYIIRSARFYPLSDATYTIMVYKNDELINETEVNDYTLDQWNEVTLSEPIVVDSKATYKLAIDCYDVTPKSPAMAVDGNNPVSGYSDIYSLDGESWNPISTSGIYANWMIGLTLESPNGVSLPIDGYDVEIDGEKKNSAKLTDTAFDYDMGSSDNLEHSIMVNVYYTVKPTTSVAGTLTTFFMGTSGIGDNVIGRIEVQKGNNVITVTGDNVTSVDLVSASGATVASAKGNTVSIDNIASGVYVVKIVAGGNTVTRKVMIVK